MPSPKPHLPTAEQQRLLASESRYADWKNWGPYLSERAWGTVREDYSPGGSAWEISATIKPAAGPSAGMKMGWVAFVIASKTSVWR
jgi:hypothetical protein